MRFFSFKTKTAALPEVRNQAVPAAPVQDSAYVSMVTELQRMPDRARLLELLDDCASRNSTARQLAPRLCRFAAEALRYIDDILPPEPKRTPREIALMLTEEERKALLQAAWAQVDDGDGKIMMHPGRYPGRLQALGLCQNWLLPPTWCSKAEQRAISEYGITRLGLIVAMHLKSVPEGERTGSVSPPQTKPE